MELDAQVEVARAALREGEQARDVFVRVARRAGDPRTAALAVSLALGIPRAQADARVRQEERIFADFGRGEEDEIGLLLDLAPTFVVDRQLDRRGQEIKRLLSAAMTAMGGVRSGLAHQLSRRLRTGDLNGAFLTLAATRPRTAHGSPPSYWAALVSAGEMLPLTEEIAEALAHCRRMAAEQSR